MEAFIRGFVIKTCLTLIYSCFIVVLLITFDLRASWAKLADAIAKNLLLLSV